MFFDLICIIFIGIGFFRGYKKGIVSSILRLGALAGSFLLVMFINSKTLIVDNPYGYFGQGFVLFAIFLAIANLIINLIKFEDIILLGTISSLVGGVLFALINAAIVFLVLSFILFFAPQASFLSNNFFYGSHAIAWVAKAIAELTVPFI